MIIRNLKAEFAQWYPIRQLNQYYDTTLERDSLKFDGASIFSTLEGMYQHFLIPKAASSALERGSKVSLSCGLVSRRFYIELIAIYSNSRTE